MTAAPSRAKCPRHRLRLVTISSEVVSLVVAELVYVATSRAERERAVPSCAPLQGCS